MESAEVQVVRVGITAIEAQQKIQVGYAKQTINSL